MIARDAFDGILDDDIGGERLFALDTLARVAAPEAEQPFAIADCFGDGLLLSRIPHLARLRARVGELGYRCVPDDDPLAGDRVIPLLQLEHILTTRTIAFRRSTPSARAILARCPAMQFDDLTFIDTFDASHVFHEAGHALAWELVRAAEGEPRGRRLVETLIATEAYTMAIEALAALADLRRSTALLLAINAYAHPFAYRSQERAAPGFVRRAHGLMRAQPRKMFRFLAGSFLVPNVRPAAVKADARLAAWLADWAGLEVDAPMAEALVSLGLGICLAFRTAVAPTYFRYLGVEADLHALCKEPMGASYRPGAVFHDHVDPLASVLFPDP